MADPCQIGDDRAAAAGLRGHVSEKGLRVGFTGTLFVVRGDHARSLPAVEADPEPYQTRGEWTVWYVDEELVGVSARQTLDALWRATNTPVLSAFIFDSDCALISARDDRAGEWDACLVRGVVASLDEVDDDELAGRYGSPAETTERATAWARSGGLNPDPTRLLDVFAFEDADEIFLGLKLFDAMLAALGLPASEEEPFYL